jgi:hypothetical protein
MGMRRVRRTIGLTLTAGIIADNQGLPVGRRTATLPLARPWKQGFVRFCARFVEAIQFSPYCRCKQVR